MEDKRPKYIEGVGWRYETEHSQKRRHRNHRYNDVGTYLVTIVVEGRKPVFGRIEGNIKARPTAIDYPTTVLSPLGEKLLYEELPKIHAIYPMVEVWKACIMPDHIHLIVRINALMPEKKYLGTVIGAFKGGVSRAWGKGSLFEANYNDRILMRDGQLDNWKAYLNANPFRRLVMHTKPEVMRRATCLKINGVRYGAFGNFLLLRHPEKVQVFFHRRMKDDRLTPATQEPSQRLELLPQMIPTEQTLFWQSEHRRLMEAADQGDVIVTPGISECEKRIKNECIEHRYRLIHLQAEPIGQYWKPERSRFEACTAGTLLILAPWHDDLKGDSDYERFHNLNNIAAAICRLDATTHTEGITITIDTTWNELINTGF
ncbi:MAG: hypothetical protein Q4A08_09455 [Bacteroidales bacterium]|nr:hypothetical protein [Bacteroidales bacterium]